MLKIEFYKEHKDAKIPTVAYENTSSCFDFYAVEDIVIPANSCNYVPNGLRVIIPDGYYLTFHTRSSMGYVKDLFVYPGILDPSYTGNLDIKIYNFSNMDYNIEKGQKYAQGSFHAINAVNFVEINQEQFLEIEKNAMRGTKGWGSTGK
jgi:dUTP pyrophosphatase